MATTTSKSARATTRIETLLDHVWQRHGTDLLLTVGSPPLVRVDGEMHRVPGEVALTSDDTKALVAALLSDADDRELFLHRHEVDFAFQWQHHARVRGNAFLQQGEATVALRMIPTAIPTMEDLDLPPVLRQMIERPSGLVLVTGPTGGGKSTTLASMVDHLNRTRPCHILTIEDPIEYVHGHALAAVNQREVGSDTESFAQALRSSLREDPDVLMVGEMRDLESIDTVLTLAETGHLVFATLHTNDTAQAIDRLLGVFPGDRQVQARLQVSASLVGVVYQRLVPKIDGGMIAAFELLAGTHAVRNLIREGSTRQLRNAITMGQGDGMQTLEMHLSRLVLDGVISRDDAVARSLFPAEIAQAPTPELVAVPGR